MSTENGQGPPPAPGETLRAAAEAIDAYLDKLPPTPWQFSSSSTDPGSTEAWVLAADDALVAVVEQNGSASAHTPRWIVLSPTLLRMVGEYLEDLANDALEMPADMRAVAVAEVVLLALAPGD